jgi:PKD domain
MSRWRTGLLLLALCVFPAGASAEGWTPPEVLTAPGLPASGVQIEASAAGVLTAGYRVLDGGIQKLFVRHRAPGEAWSVPVLISTPTDVLDWDLDVGPDGTAAVVWTEFDGADNIIVVRIRPAGGAPWGAPEVLSASGNDAILPRVSVDGPGHIVAAWGFGPTPNWTVETRTRAANGIWSAPDSSSLGNVPTELQVDASGGHAGVVWVNQPSADKRVWAVVRDTPTGSWSVVASINVSLTNGTNAAVGVAPDGAAIVAYLHQDGPSFTVRASRRPPASIFPSSADVVSAADVNSGGIALEVGDSEATIAFPVPDVARRIDAATAPLGSAFGTPVTLSDGFPVTGRPSLAGDGAGGVVATWSQGEAGGERIVARRRSLSGVWAPPIKTAPRPFAVDGPFVAALPAGEAAVAWVAPAGGADAAHVAVLDQVSPVPLSLALPPATRVGDLTPFAASFADLWALSPLAPRWDFGDGAKADGANVTHVFGLPGTYTVRLEHADAALNPFLASHELRVDPIPPRAETTKSTFSGTTTAQFEGTVWPSGRVTQYHFEYGRTTAYGSRTARLFTPAPVGRFDVKRVATGLVPGATYHYRLVATAGADTNRGADRTVTTLAPPATFTAPGGGSKVPVGVSGRARIAARCVTTCRGSVRLFAVVHPKHGKRSKAVEMRHGRRVRIGSRSFSRSSAGTTTLSVQLSAAGRALLAAQGTIRAYVVANVRSRGRTVRTTTTVTLVASTKTKRTAEVERK